MSIICRRSGTRPDAVQRMSRPSGDSLDLQSVMDDPSGEEMRRTVERGPGVVRSSRHAGTDGSAACRCRPGLRADGVLGLLQRERPHYSPATRLMLSWMRSKASGPMPAPPRKG